MRVLWGPDENCHSANSREVKAYAPKCSLVNIDDETFRIVFFREISFAINSNYYVVGKRNYLQSAVQLTNGSGSEVQLDPKTWEVYSYASEADFLNRVGNPKIIRATQASRIKLPRKVTIVEKPSSAGPPGTDGVARVEVLKPPGQLTPKDRSAIQDVKPFGTVPSVSVGRTNVTSGPSREVSKNELVKKLIGAGDKTAGYVFFLDVPRQGHVVAVIRLKDLEVIFPIETSP